MEKILYVEDDLSLIDGLQYTLESSGYAVDNARTVKEALSLFRSNHYDLLLLDVTLPDGTGFDVCKEVRSSSTIPIIFLTASDQEISIVKGLDMGGDDYITKPFRVRELISRIKSVLRRYKGDSNHSQFKLGDLRVNTSEARVWKQGEEVLLTALEYRLLLAFLNHPGQVLTRGQLLENIWDVAGDFVNDNTLTVYIKRLRDKLEQDPQDPQIIKTVRGVGYKLEKEGQL